MNRQAIDRLPSRAAILGALGDLEEDLMKMNQFFDVFLEDAKFDNDDTSTPEWVTYKEMLKRYDHTADAIQYARYRLKHA